MKKGIFDVKLVNRPRGRDIKTKNNTNSAWFNDRRESLVEIDSMLLRKTPTDPSSLIACKSTVSVKLVLKNPLTGDDIGVSGFRY